MSTARHRGRHPRDDELFDDAALPALRRAASDLAWLLERGYAEPSALKLVGDRHELRGRQRAALSRSVAAAPTARARRDKRVELPGLAGRPLLIDGLNCLITVEAAIAGAMVLVGDDGAWRDLASVHGTWRRVAETDRAITAIGEVLASSPPSSIRWLIDRPVSNSGRLAARLRERAAERGWRWEVEAVHSPDREIIGATGAVAASSDSWILDSCAAWIDLPRAAIENTRGDGETPRAPITPWVVDLRGDPRGDPRGDR